MNTSVTLSLLLLTALLTSSGVVSQAPSVSEFAAFCNEVASSGSASSPFLEVLCRQLAERLPPPTAATSWSEAQQVPTVAYEQGIPPSAQLVERVVANQGNDQPLENETLNIDNALPGADNMTDIFSVGGGQTIIILNNTFPPDQIDLEVGGGSDFTSNIELSTTEKLKNLSFALPENNFFHIEPHNVSTFYVGGRAQGELQGNDGRNGTLNSTRAFRAPVANLNPLKRGDQMPVPGNISNTLSSFQERSGNQMYNNTNTVGRLPEAGLQQPLREEGVLIQQSDIESSNGTLTTNHSTDVLQVGDKEQTNVPADGVSTALHSQTEEQVYIEQQSTITSSETEAPVTAEVAKDTLNNSSVGSTMTGIEIQDGNTANGSSTQPGIHVMNVNNSTELSPDVGREPEILNIQATNVDGFFEVQTSNLEYVPPQFTEQVSTGTYLLVESTTLPTLGNEQSLGSEQGPIRGQSVIDQVVENVPHDSGAVETQSTLELEPSQDWLETNAAKDQPAIFSTESVVDDTQNNAQPNDQGSKGHSPAIAGGSLGYENPNEVWSTSTVLPTTSLTSEQGLLRNHQNEMGDAQQTLTAEPSGNSENKAETTSSHPFVMDLPTEALPNNAGPAGFNTQFANPDTSLSEGASNSSWGTASSTQLGFVVSSSSSSVGSNSKVTVGVSSSERKSVASTSLPPTTEGDVVRDSILALKELSTKLLGGMAEVHCRLSLNEFWKNVTEVFRTVSTARKPTVRDMTASVTEVIESYRRESPYWKTIATKLEEATSERRWRQLVAAVAQRHRGDRAAQLRMLAASRELRQAVQASLSSPECRAAGAQPVAGSCDQFVLCYRAGWQWRELNLHCPRGTAFSHSERHCVWRPFADCRPEPSADRRDDDDDSSSDPSNSDSDSSESEERSWPLFRHAHPLFRMFDFRNY